jgi:hypothetical protein
LPEKGEDVLCAHTVRRLKPGMLEQDAEALRPGEDNPRGRVRFHVLRGLADGNEI